MTWNSIVIHVFIAKFELYTVTRANIFIAHPIPSTCQFYLFMVDLSNSVVRGTERVVLNNDADDVLESSLCLILGGTSGKLTIERLRKAKKHLCILCIRVKV